ncbi:hypothetical protein CASFOL_040647 [Castilleja foliolosa]|uniref:Pentatricopeptide repeat-containing protein n=1 Tax=Castilleja foliolosa TaxID=1961234 RepID=A0ABD3BD39_9LAMI
MVARLTPDQKVACSIHVGFKTPNQADYSFYFLFPHFFSGKFNGVNPISMAFRSKVRSLSLTTRQSPFFFLNPKAALYLLWFEKNPKRILENIQAIFKLKESHYYEGSRSFINDSLTRPDLKSERFSLAFHRPLRPIGSGLIKDAIKLFDEMPNLGVPNGVKALNSLLFSCILAGEYGEMKRVFSEFPRKYVRPGAGFRHVLHRFEGLST